jgi:hypothetical protein
MICSSVKRDPFISASYSGRTLLKTGGVCGAQVRNIEMQLDPLHMPGQAIEPAGECRLQLVGAV